MDEMKKGTDAWESFKGELAASFQPGDLITHDFLKQKFNFKEITFDDYEDESAFITAIGLQQFNYMSLIDHLRWEMLEDYKVFLRNIRGEGYSFLQPGDQVQYAYDTAISSIRKEISEADLIMTNVMSVDAEQQKADNDARAKFAMMKQLLKGLRK